MTWRNEPTGLVSWTTVCLPEGKNVLVDEEETEGTKIIIVVVRG